MLLKKKTRATAPLTAATAPIPAAVALLQRNPDADEPYPLRLRVVDTWRGFRDRRRVTAHLGDRSRKPVAVVPRFGTDALEHLGAECLTRQEVERRTTRAAIAVLDDTITAQRRTVIQLTARLPELDQQIDAVTAEKVSDAPRTSAEQYDTPQQRLARREREHQARILALKSERKQVLGRIEAAGRQIDEALEARRAHWDQLLVRVALLTAHYNRRSRTYARSATRRSRVLISASDRLVDIPDWCVPEAIPQEPTPL
ncbi:hypothetical protein ACWDTG_25925 [Rhodococcus zopfii]